MRNMDNQNQSKHLFVYGTLQYGQSRHHILEGLRYEKATLPKHKRVSPPSLGFPFIVFNEASKVEGEVYYDIDEELIKTLDLIEGEGSLYHRIIVEVLTEDGTKIQAYTYYPSEILIKKFI